MRTVVTLLALSALISSNSFAQDKRFVEVGTAFGVTLSIPDDGDTEVFAGVPGAGTFIGFPSLYATFFATPALMIEPQLYFYYSSLDEEALISPMLQLGYLFKPEANASPYVAINGGGFFFTEGGASNSGAVGAAVGYRFSLSSGAAFRTELLYRRWLGEYWEFSDLSLRLGLGAVL